MPQWRVNVTMSGSPHGGPGAGNLIVRTKLGCSVQVGGIPVGGDWQAALCPGFHYSSTQVTDFTAVILHQYCLHSHVGNLPTTADR